MSSLVCRVVTSVTLVALCVVGVTPVWLLAAGEATGSTDVTLFRVFLKDGSAVVSYGEFARVGDEVVLSMPLGPDLSNPTLQLITLTVDSVDWPRTEEYTNSVRYQRYVNTSAEDDFAVMSAEVAAILNEIATSTDPQRAISLADEAKRRLVGWPSQHFGYRASDVGDIIGLIDEAISRIGARTSGGPIQFSLIAASTPAPVDVLAGMPDTREQVKRLLALASGSGRPTDRVSLLRAALTVLDDPKSGIGHDESAEVRRIIRGQLDEETAVDASYARLTTRLLGAAQRAAANASVSGVERVLDSVKQEDVTLGVKRPDTVRALQVELQDRLDAARDLRLRRDQWTVRRGIYREYVETVSVQISQLVKAQSSLDSIRRLAGPSPSRLQSLHSTLVNGVERLQSVIPPEQMRPAHELLLSAWRFAESATDTRQKAIASGDMSTAWQASSAAAGSLMLLTRVQNELRTALEPPKLR